jgi:MFS family permease
MVIAAVPLGLIIDRYSRVRLLCIFAVIDLVASVATALASSFAMLFLARCLVGLAATVVSTAVFSLLADLYAAAQRGRASMVVVVGQSAGMSAAFALGGAFLALTAPCPHAWQWTIFWLSAPLVPVALLMPAIRELPRTGLVIRNPSLRDTLAELWRCRAFMGVFLVGFSLTKIANVAALTWATPTLSRHFELSPERIGMIMAGIVLVSSILGSVAGGVLADVCQRRGGPHRTMAMLSGLALLSVPTGLFAAVPGVGSAALLLVLLLTLVVAIIVAGVALFSIVIPNELRGFCMTLLATVEVFFGIGLAPVMVSALSSALGGPTMIGKALTLVCVAASLLATATFLSGIRYFPRRSH